MDLFHGGLCTIQSFSVETWAGVHRTLKHTMQWHLVQTTTVDQLNCHFIKQQQQQQYQHQRQHQHQHQQQEQQEQQERQQQQRCPSRGSEMPKPVASAAPHGIDHPVDPMEMTHWDIICYVYSISYIWILYIYVYVMCIYIYVHIKHQITLHHTARHSCIWWFWIFLENEVEFPGMVTSPW